MAWMHMTGRTGRIARSLFLSPAAGVYTFFPQMWQLNKLTLPAPVNNYPRTDRAREGGSDRGGREEGMREGMRQRKRQREGETERGRGE